MQVVFFGLFRLGPPSGSSFGSLDQVAGLVAFSVDQGSTVGDLKVLAHQTLQQEFLRLVTTEGRVLDDFQQSLLTAWLQDGDHVTAFVLQPRVVGTSLADLSNDD